MQKKIEILFIIVVNVHKQTNTKKQQATSIRWHHAALDGCTRRTTDNIYRTRSTSSHHSGVVKLAIGTTPPRYFTTLRGMNPRHMFPFY